MPSPTLIARALLATAAVSLAASLVCAWRSRRNGAGGWLRAAVLMTLPLAAFWLWSLQSWAIQRWGLDAAAPLAGLGAVCLLAGAVAGLFLGALWGRTE